MKGIVMKINRMEAVVLSEDGFFFKVRDKRYVIGQEVVCPSVRKKKILAIAGAAAAVLVFVCGGFAYCTPATYVSLDVNPSIAFSLNAFNRVLDVQPVDSEAEPIVGELNLKNRTIDEAMQRTIEKLIDRGYITEDESGDVMIATSNKNAAAAQRLADRLQENVQNIIAGQGKAAVVEAETVDSGRVQEAKALGVTPGKLNLVERLKDGSAHPEDIDVQKWLGKSVKDIQDSIKENENTRKTPQNNEGTATSTTPRNNASPKDGTARTDDGTTKEDKTVYEGNRTASPDENGDTQENRTRASDHGEKRTTSAPETTRASHGKEEAQNMKSRGMK